VTKDTAAEPCDLDDDAVAASNGDELPDEGQCEADPAATKGLRKVDGQAVDLLYIGPLQAIVDVLDAVRELVRLLSTRGARRGLGGMPSRSSSSVASEERAQRSLETRRRKCATVGHCRHIAKAHLHAPRCQICRQGL